MRVDLFTYKSSKPYQSFGAPSIIWTARERTTPVDRQLKSIPPFFHLNRALLASLAAAEGIWCLHKDTSTALNDTWQTHRPKGRWETRQRKEPKAKSSTKNSGITEEEKRKDHNQRRNRRIKRWKLRTMLWRLWKRGWQRATTLKQLKRKVKTEA